MKRMEPHSAISFGGVSCPAHWIPKRLSKAIGMESVDNTKLLWHNGMTRVNLSVWEPEESNCAMNCPRNKGTTTNLTTLLKVQGTVL